MYLCRFVTTELVSLEDEESARTRGVLDVDGYYSIRDCDARPRDDVVTEP